MFIEAGAIKPPRFHLLPCVLLFNSSAEGEIKLCRFGSMLRNTPFVLKGVTHALHLQRNPQLLHILLPLDTPGRFERIPTKSVVFMHLMLVRGRLQNEMVPNVLH